MKVLERATELFPQQKSAFLLSAEDEEFYNRQIAEQHGILDLIPRVRGGLRFIRLQDLTPTPFLEESFSASKVIYTDAAEATQIQDRLFVAEAGRAVVVALIDLDPDVDVQRCYRKALMNDPDVLIFAVQKKAERNSSPYLELINFCTSTGHAVVVIES